MREQPGYDLLRQVVASPMSIAGDKDTGTHVQIIADA